MKISLLLLLLFTEAFATTPESQKCHTQNMITEPNSPFEKIQVYDQDGAGICYAYTAAQMMDYYTLKNGAKERQYNPLFIAVAASDRARQDFITGGNASTGISALLEHGNCPYWSVIASIRTWLLREPIPENKVLAIIESFALRIKESQAKSPTPLSQIDLVLFMQESFKEHGEKCSQNYTLGMEEFLGDLSKLTPRQLLSDIMFSNCPRPLSVVNVPNPIRFETNAFPTPESTTLKLKELLNTRKQPVAIGFCAQVLADPAHRGVARSEQTGNISGVTSDCGAHEALIVGKKWMGSECGYLLRNSWGSGWSEWNMNRTCVCKYKKTNPTTGKLEAHVDEACTFAKYGKDKGVRVEGCYVSETDLKPNLFNLTTL